METDLFDTYQTDGSANIISITVTVGYAQIASTAISINAEPYIITPPAGADGNYVDSFTLNLGTNASLKGKSLQVVPMVSRVQADAPNSTVIIALTSNGVTHTYPTLGTTIPAVGGVANYFALITLN